MLMNKITIDLLTSGQIKTVGVLDYQSRCYVDCKVLNYLKIGNDWVLQLRTPKKWAYGEMNIYRSLQEVA
jgi:hypothetical protein